MTQLVYHPAFDPYNALLRECRILLAIPSGVDRTSLRILEFFLLFPESVRDMRIPTKLKNAAKKLSVGPRYPYDRLPSARALFERMQPTFEAALQTMQSRGLVHAPDDGNLIRLNVDAVPESLLTLAITQNKDESDLIEILTTIASVYPSSGPNGLKDRSGLQEFHYDIV